ncbi:putative cytosolic iron-sulfur protein assembly protein Ciao1 [Linderina pennispora]|uniref:Probable cytosolic iron-sulfur protein assembly protein 1 n=1 Tax=Linderina pennispora TaxID=61395 RepID=A0A1Y1WCC7_9FUNG|nr:putative cytosolic iron-sulfur protein assembly protein Ciao1 [Linderina pennispora]ORX70814.1 putative cytosolic iron-sulfur protein assembly protein Ciao1 [Linderina pennispora]
MPQLRLFAELAGHDDRVWQVSWDKTGTRLATCSGDKSARVWAPVAGSSFFDAPGTAIAPSTGDSARTSASWQCLDTIDNAHKRTVRSVCFEPGSQTTLATASFDGTTAIWAQEDGSYECVATLEGHENEAKSVAWSPGGQLLATCGRDKSVWIWEATGEGDFDCISVLMEHTQDVKAVVWHPSQELLVSFSYDDSIRVWQDDDDDWYCAAVLSGHSSTVWGGAFSHDGRFLASVSDDRTVRIWAEQKKEAQSDGFYYRPEVSYQCVSVVPESVHARAIYSVAWSAPADGAPLGFVATGCGDNSVRVFSATGDDKVELELAAEVQNAHGLSDINCVQWNPQHPRWLATAGDDAIVRIWYLE